MEIEGGDTIKLLKILKKFHLKAKPKHKAFVKNIADKLIELEKLKIRESELESKVGTLQLAVESLAIKVATGEFHLENEEARTRRDAWSDLSI